MKTILKISLTLAIAVAVANVAFANGRHGGSHSPGVGSSNIVTPVDPAVDQNGNPIVDPVVYNSFCNPINPIVAPDGHQVTYCEWTRGTGAAAMQCEGSRGTRVRVDLSGLLPNAVYSVWVLVFGPGPAAPDGSNLLGAGALGRPDGSQNVFTASPDGQGHLAAIMPASTLSLIPYPVSACLSNTPGVGEVQIHVGYHLDGEGHHGGGLGDDCNFAVPLGFRFPL